MAGVPIQNSPGAGRFSSACKVCTWTSSPQPGKRIGRDATIACHESWTYHRARKLHCIAPFRGVLRSVLQIAPKGLLIQPDSVIIY